MVQIHSPRPFFYFNFNEISSTSSRYMRYLMEV